MYPVSEQIVEVIEVIGAENAKPYTDKGWVVLGVVSTYDLTDGHFIYSLGRPLYAPGESSPG